MTQKASNRRLDIAVADTASISRERAQALILEGKVLVDGAPVTKAGAIVRDGMRIEVKDDARFVSRGGEKLERALVTFAWSVDGLNCLDVGASTGGFTDCLLQRGAARVTAVDVGYGQLAWSLRSDPRVRPIERCNFRLADPAALGAPFDFASVDVSFISLTKIAVKLRASLREGGRLVALVKPQFEAGRRAVGKGGVVRDAATHVAVIESVTSSLDAAGLHPVALTFSPIKGPAGNIEFLLGCTADDVDESHMRSSPADHTGRSLRRDVDVAGVVTAAHEALA